MTLLEAIELRSSRRGYTGPVPAQQAKSLHTMVADINRDSGLSIRLLEDGGELFAGFGKSYGMFTGVRSLFVLAGPEEDPHLLEKAGYYGEQLVLQAVALGLGTCWVGGTFDRKGLAKTIAPGHRLAAVVVVGEVEQARGIKENILYGMIHRRMKTADQMFTADCPPPGWFMAGVEAAALAPSAMNRQPVIFCWKDDRVTAAVPDNSAMEKVDLGVAKLHFELAANGRFEWGNGGVFAPEAATKTQP